MITIPFFYFSLICFIFLHMGSVKYILYIFGLATLHGISSKDFLGKKYHDSKINMKSISQ